MIPCLILLKIWPIRWHLVERNTQFHSNRSQSELVNNKTFKSNNTSDRYITKGWIDSVPASYKQPPPLSLTRFSRSQPHFLKRPPKISCHWTVSVSSCFQELVIVSSHRILSNPRFLPGTAIHWSCAHTHELPYTQSHCVRMQAHAHAHYLATHWVSDPHIKNTAERPYWWGADRRDSFLCVVHQSVQGEW